MVLKPPYAASVFMKDARKNIMALADRTEGKSTPTARSMFSAGMTAPMLKRYARAMAITARLINRPIRNVLSMYPRVNAIGFVGEDMKSSTTPVLLSLTMH